MQPTNLPSEASAEEKYCSGAVPLDHPNESEQKDFGFEGCEKRLILCFQGSGDLRTIKKTVWIDILKHANCAILNTIENDKCIAHLLSESSLFIFKDKLMIKTCGTTTLLLILPQIIAASNPIHLTIHDVFFSRSNFMFPAAQPTLHRTFDGEVDYLLKYFDGKGVILGSMNEARWHCFQSSHNANCDTIAPSQTLEIVMFDLDSECMAQFHATKNASSSNLDEIVCNGCCIPKNVQIDSYMFKPCGYSLNGIMGDRYWTIHITPEKDASFVSFETSYDYQEGYADVIDKVITFFKPKRFSFAVNHYGDEHILKGSSLCGFDGFALSDRSHYAFSNNHGIRWSNYKRMEELQPVSATQARMKALDVSTDDSSSLWKFIHQNIVNRDFSKSMSHLLSFTRS